MNKIKKIKLVALVMFSLCIGLCCPMESKAASVNTGVRSSSGPYNLSVYEMGSYTSLGTMSMWYSSTYKTVYNQFNADQTCTATVYVSPIASGYSSNSATISNGGSVITSKKVSGTYSKTYGYCIVSY